MQKVLMIDNAKLMHTVVQARLLDEELAFYSAYSGDEGIELARRIKPDIILLDVEMPPPNGFEVCRILKSDEALSAIPIIFLTGVTSTEEKVKGLNLGAADYVTKPFETAELIARVRASFRTKELIDLLERRAMIDSLTGIWNRAYFDYRLVSELSLTQRASRPLSCILMDVDRFKSVNDTHGHGFGDIVLRAVAQRLQEQSRAEDIVCRYGGEEFVTLLPGIDAAGATAFAERLRVSIASRAVVRNGITLEVTCSFGVADAKEGFENLVERADRALYRAKRSGRNRVELDTMNACNVGV